MSALPTRRAEDRRSRFRRVLIALDALSDDVSVLQSAADLAALLRVELRALFVEDIDLLTLAEHPGASAFGISSARRYPLDADSMRRALRAQMAARRRAIEEAAERRHLKVSFLVRRGRLPAEVAASAEEADLVVMDWECGAIAPSRGGRRPRPGLMACSVASIVARSVLLLRPGAAAGGPALVAYDGSAGAEKAIDSGADLAGGQGLIVALLTEHPDEAEGWQEALARRLSPRRLEARFVQLPQAGIERLGDLAREKGAPLIVLGADQDIVAGAEPRALLERVDRSVLLVR